jgi:hypothetical protein
MSVVTVSKGRSTLYSAVASETIKNASELAMVMRWML